jgi:pSer/pThr/pTyr-binding forkhead associated (FHA) protein
VDAGSTNGTYLNGRRLSDEQETSAPHELHAGDELVRPVLYQLWTQLIRLQVIGIDITEDDGRIIFQKVAARVMFGSPDDAKVENAKL